MLEQRTATIQGTASTVRIGVNNANRRSNRAWNSNSAERPFRNSPLNSRSG